MKSLNYLNLLIFLNFTVSACSQDPVPLVEEYRACCGVEPVEYNINLLDGTKAYVYIPNSFTPNGDGINDIFSAVFNEQIDIILNLEITKDVFDNTTNALLYDENNITRENINEKAWRGRDMDGNLHKGLFNYEMYFIAKSGQIFGISGKACSIICGEDAIELKNNLRCFYQSQSNSSGRLDISLSNNETNCFR